MTIHERVHEAGDEAIRRVRHDPDYHRIPQDREETYKLASNPKSDWPEPPMEGEHLQDVMRKWLPPQSPKSPGHKKAHHRHPRAGSRQYDIDEVEGTNIQIGQQLSQMQGHGSKVMAYGAPSGPLDASEPNSMGA